MAEYHVMLEGKEFSISIDGAGEISVDGRTVLVEASDEYRWTVRNGDLIFDVRGLRQNGLIEVVVNGLRAEGSVESSRQRLLRSLVCPSAQQEGRHEVHAPMPAMVGRVLVGPGQLVTEGQGLLVLEAMKMENEVRSPRAGTVREVCVAPGTTVEKGVLLLVLE